MTEHTLTRRDAMAGTAAAAIGAAGALSITQRVAATNSGEAELTINGTIPDGTSIDATANEYDTSDSSTPINSQTVTATSSGTLVYDGLEGMGDYYYEITLSVSGDGSATPELETPLVFEVPPNFAYTNYTLSQEWSEKPDGVQIIWDEQRLWKYQPLLQMDAETRDRFDGLYGYVATSEDEDTDVLCYWSKTERVKSLPGGNDTLGSSIGDHDPIYVFVNSDTGELERIVYSGYNLEAAEIQPGTDDLVTQRADSPTHATFTVVNGWHHYRHTPEKTGFFTALKSWPAVRDTWSNNGFGPDTTAVQNPWELTTKNDWRANSGLFSLTDIWISLGKTFGWYGADETDDLRG
ncbi:hypothetical protein Htur_5020 (plasmid) [Haloterrigena turkmenica DSM 5511]|uniref:Uncharacterized protein n=1 Tax=Haloterrigena turkmenica (strain ATCC 51198 / DSM 5511 / JCM 9101 / NCIMB 13204 / VKM B-1734 / 4k) TaxID=543526 RepID=D2S3G1_HALTV|nr:hypothetical protein [Haloterrigena turkmenica]ADB63908.1 hypothetical protein Htur_5020 [Haloterrigena turkmenica DSM 5511]